MTDHTRHTPFKPYKSLTKVPGCFKMLKVLVDFCKKFQFLVDFYKKFQSNHGWSQVMEIHWNYQFAHKIFATFFHPAGWHDYFFPTPFTSMFGSKFVSPSSPSSAATWGLRRMQNPALFASGFGALWLVKGAEPWKEVVEYSWMHFQKCPKFRTADCCLTEILLVIVVCQIWHLHKNLS